MKDFMFEVRQTENRLRQRWKIAENYELIDLYGNIFYLFLDRPGIFRLIVLPKIKIYKS